MVRKIKNTLLVLLLLLSCCVFIEDAFAATIALSVRPYEGGYNLNYGKVSPASGRINKEVIIAITSDLGKQYRLVQSLLDPLSTMDGYALAPNSLWVYGIRGSSSIGTLNAEEEFPVTLNQRTLYTSNQVGESDSFTLVYGLVLPEDVQPGAYRGRMSFTVEPIDSTTAPQTVILNIVAEVEGESAIQIRTAAGTKTVALKPGKEDSSSCDVVFNARGNFGGQFRILQLIEEQPVSSEGNLLGWEAVKFVGRDAEKGIVVNEPMAISGREQVVYTSSPRGEEEPFVLSYNLGDLSAEKAGIYRGRIKYILDGMSPAANRLLDTLDLEIENPQVFDLAIAPEVGGTLRFSNLTPLQPPQTQEVTFEIKTNLYKPYQVTQVMNAPLTSKEGRSLPKANFTLRQMSLETKGKLKYPDKSEVQEGQMLLFVSDENGSPDKFKVIYELSAPREIHPGDYYTNFSYSVSEI